MANEYPVPVTPSPLISAHTIEIDRAKAAEEAACQSPAVTATSILYEDDWIVAVNKPAGRYCEDVLSGVMELLSDRQRRCSHHEASPGGNPPLHTKTADGDQSRPNRVEETAVNREQRFGAGVGESKDGVKNVGRSPPRIALTPSKERIHSRPAEARLAKQNRREAIGNLDGTRSESALAYMVHRLDRDTSGVQIVAKSKQAAAAFMKLFADRHVEKTYLALGQGTCPNWQQTTLRTGHGRSRHGMFRVYAEEDIGRSLPGGKAARVQGMETKFEVLGTFVSGDGHGGWNGGKRPGYEYEDLVAPVCNEQGQVRSAENGICALRGGCLAAGGVAAAETKAEIGTELDTSTEAETETETDTRTVTITAAQTKADVETEPGTESETERERVTETKETQTEPVTELGTGIAKQVASESGRAPGEVAANLDNQMQKDIGLRDKCAASTTASGPSRDDAWRFQTPTQQGNSVKDYANGLGQGDANESSEGEEDKLDLRVERLGRERVGNPFNTSEHASSVSASFVAERVQAGLSLVEPSTSGDLAKTHCNREELLQVDTRRLPAEEHTAHMSRFVLLRCYPLTGRTHQIRLHCLYLGLPLVGDARYGGLLEAAGKEQRAHCLHAESITLKHPFLMSELHLKAPDPPWVEVGRL